MAANMNFAPAMIKFFRLTICLLLVNCLPVFCQNCPSPEYISPCTCIELDEAEVICKGIENGQQLKEVFDKTADYFFWSFIIRNSSFPYLPSTAIVEKRVRFLYVADSVMTSLFDRPPSSNNTLKKILFSNFVLRRGFKWELFSKLVHLEDFEVSQSDIKKIDQSFVDNFPTGVTRLFFSGTKLNTLHDYAFSKLTELIALSLTSNEISTLKRSMFAPEPKLVSINFSYTKISTLPNDFFENMPKLKIVYFGNTDIVVLQESVFKRILPQIDHLYLAGDKLNCNCQMKWLTTVKMQGYITAKCDKPPALKGLSIRDIKSSQFPNCQ